VTMLPTLRASLVEAAAEPLVAFQPVDDAAMARRTRRPSRAPRCWAALTAGGLCCAAVAGAVMLPGARAGQPAADRAMTAAIGTGYAAGPGVLRAAQAIATVTPYPPGAADSLSWVRPLAASRQPVERISLAVSLQQRARCSWYRYWLASVGRDRAAATAVLQAAVSWPSVNAAADGRATAVAVAAAARSGDAAPIQSHLELDC